MPDVLERPDPMGAFLRYLATFPNPGSVAEVLAHGPLQMLATRSCSLLVAQGNELHTFSSYGYGSDIPPPFRRISIDVHLPVAKSFRSNRLLLVDAHRARTDYHAVGIVSPQLLANLDSPDEGAIVCLPIVAQGTPIGALGFVCSKPPRWSPAHYTLFDSLAASLSLWMSNPMSTVVPSSRLTQSPDETPFALDERQVAILRMVERGLTTPQIMEELHCSESTVKKSLHRAMKLLGADTRTETVTKARSIGLLT